MIYVLAYPTFDQRSTELIDAFREKHEPQRAKLVPPHITLVFGVTNEHLQSVSGLVDVVSQQSSAVTVTFDSHVTEFDPFEKKYKIFLLCGEGRAAIKSLHNQLYEGAQRSEYSLSHPFKPHMTIGSYTEQADVDQVDVSAVGEFPIRGQVSSLELVQLESGQLKTLKTAPLIK